MKPKVYLETSFVRYVAGRLSEDLSTLQRQLSSQRWWEQERHNFDLVVSQTVYEECLRGNEQAVQGRSAILQETTLLPLTREILEVARRLVNPGPFPLKAEADALHVAAATTVYGCEFLLTWSFRHINNAQMKREASRIIEEYGYQPATICSPEELMGSDPEAEG
ncbi:MAG: type II toxin-antitoxin system VapC family toxin [Candidatus Solibacter sp.]|nr:type II toxin-antitoxin system VapC family toxin [Candidatus Solibacter sp.]